MNNAATTGAVTRAQIKGFRGEAYEAGDFYSAAVAEAALDRWYSAHDAIAKCTPEEIARFEEVYRARLDVAAAARTVEAWIGFVRAQVSP